MIPRVVACLVAATPAAGSAAVQQSPTGHPAAGLEEIIVTAQRTAQDLQVVPISVEALTRQDVERAGLKDLRNLDRVSPGITGGQSVRALGGRIGIRGFNDLDRNAGGERSVGIYVDGVYSGRKDALTEPTVGIERIEVLRGPQGTLFGRNSTAGVVSLTTRKPTDHPEVSLALNVGNYSTTDVEGWIGGPLAGDTLMGSLSVGYHDDDGYVDNVALGNRQASYRTLSGRGLLRWSPSERLRVDLALDGLEDEGEGYNGEATQPPQVTVAPGPFTVAMNTGQLDTTDKYGAAVTMTYRLANDLELMSLTAYRNARLHATADEDQAPIDIASTFPAQYRNHQFTEELHLVGRPSPRIDWLAGVYFLDASNEDHGEPKAGAAFPVPSLRNQGATVDAQTDVESYAAFFHVNYRLTDALQVTGGLRYTHESKHATFEQVSTMVPVLINIPRFSDDRSDDDMSPKLALSYFADDHTMFYATAARGFKSGGWNLDVTSTPKPDPANDLAYDPQGVTNYEAGLKSELLGRQLRLNGALYLMKSDDYQVFQFLPQPTSPPTTDVRITNAGKVTSQGVELEADAAVTDQLALGLSVVYNDTKFDEFRNGGGTGVDFDGNVLPFAPKWKGRLSVDHRAALGARGSVVTSVAAIYNGSLYTNPNNLPMNFVHSYTLLDAQLGYESDGGGWGVYLWGTNLTDETYSINTNLNFLNIARSTYGWPRQYGVRVRFDYQERDSR